MTLAFKILWNLFFTNHHIFRPRIFRDNESVLKQREKNNTNSDLPPSEEMADGRYVWQSQYESMFLSLSACRGDGSITPYLLNLSTCMVVRLGFTVRPSYSENVDSRAGLDAATEMSTPLTEYGHRPCKPQLFTLLSAIPAPLRPAMHP
jgi:hypothetical protein